MAKDVPMKGGLPINEDEKAETIAIFTPSITCQRPYMRGFHGAWFGFFIAFVRGYPGTRTPYRPSYSYLDTGSSVCRCEACSWGS